MEMSSADHKDTGRSSFGIYEGVHKLGLGGVVTGIIFSFTELDLCFLLFIK